MPLKFTLTWIAVVTIAAIVQSRTGPLDGKKKFPEIGNKKHLCYELEKENGDALQVVCNGIYSLQGVLQYFTKEQLRKITKLTFAQSNLASLNLDDLVNLTSLHTLLFNQSMISEWILPTSISVPEVKVLILNDCWNNGDLLDPNGNASLQFTLGIFDGLSSLEQLHLVSCYVSSMTPEIFTNVTSLKKLHISDGSGIGCEPQMSWMLDWIDEGKAVVANDTKCFVPRDMKQGGGGVLIMSTFYSLSGHPFFLVMGHRKDTQKHCPKECRCVVEGFNFDPIINIYCVNAGLTSLPEIPPYSTRLSFQNNSITDITPLFTNERYHYVTSIRLEHNRVSHVDGDLLYNFMKDRSQDLLIALSHNNVSTLPVKQILRLYEESRELNGLKLFVTLEFNPWDCNNCEFLPEFQKVVYYQYSNRDTGSQFFRNIRCVKGNELTSGEMVIRLDVQSLCTPDPPLLEPIDIVNISLGLVIIVLIANFAYNFYQYRQHSKLPWIITKMPCC